MSSPKALVAHEGDISIIQSFSKKLISREESFSLESLAESIKTASLRMRAKQILANIISFGEASYVLDKSLAPEKTTSIFQSFDSQIREALHLHGGADHLNIHVQEKWGSYGERFSLPENFSSLNPKKEKGKILSSEELLYINQSKLWLFREDFLWFCNHYSLKEIKE